jgi:hypothetical protein
MKSSFAALAVSMVAIASLFAQSSNPVPFINQPLLPASVVPGSAVFTLTLNGTGFVSGAVVKVNGASVTTTFVNSNQLKATIPAADVATARTDEISVLNPGTAEGSNIVYLPVVAPFTNVTMLRQDYATGNGPGSIGVGDFNGDGIQDLVYGTFGYSGASYLTVFLGYGDGSFQEMPVTYATGAVPLSIAVGDFNGDGKLDIATANSNAGSISVLLGNGDGTFQTHVDYHVGTFFTEGIATGDFNHDGKLDLVTANLSDNNVGVLLGNGDGTFQPVVTYPVGNNPYTVITADFNRDGNLDLAVVNDMSSSVSVLLGRGDGTFNSHVDYTVAQYPLGLVAADFNGDGILDIAAVSTDDAGTLSLLLGKGDGTFTAGTSMGTFNQAQAIVAGDFNGDGKLDVAVQTFNCPVSCSVGTLALLLGNGNGTFQAPLGFSTANLGSYVVSGDFNNDGKLDFAVGVYYSSNLATVLLQTPDVSVSPGVINFGSQNTGTSSAPQNVTLTNNTANTITITSIAAPAQFTETNTCGTLPAALGSGASCILSVAFAPTADGNFSGAVTITDNGGTGTQQIHVTGTGVTPVATLSRTRISFPATPVGQKSAPQVVRLTNTGTANLSIASITLTGDSGNFTETNRCPRSLGPGFGCPITITFTPQTKGVLRGGVSIVDNSTPPTQTLNLFGTGD